MPLASDWELKPTLSWQHNLRRANRPGQPLSAGYDGTIHLEFDRYVAQLEAIHGPLGPLDGGTLGAEYSNKIQYSRGTTVLAPGGEVSNLALFAFERFAERGPIREPYLTLGMRHAAAKDAAPGEPFAQFDQLPFGTASTEAYTLADLDLGFAFRAFGNRLARVDLTVRNLFDTEYRDFLDTYKGYALSPGRDIRVSLSVPFGG
ncbi:TonB-dependent receptor [Halochromatium salexigens]|uniref:TonB-dependent receptor n=1 Tax=Halochromatium salexigens TaxID=49447 RepID=UPI001F5C6429|nr:TonB-dependent receptor [Halochromatium salexigens]